MSTAALGQNIVDLMAPNSLVSGYLGTISISEEQKELAISAARQRQSIALNGNFQKKPRDPIAQFINDLKGTLAEVGLTDYIATIANSNNIELEVVELVADAPIAKQDITLSGLKFDIKGCAGPLDGLIKRDDKLLIINCKQHLIKYKGYKGYFWLKTYENHQDIFYFTRAEVSTWNKLQMFPDYLSYFERTIPALH
jgi:hypothetical protein